MTDLAVEIRGLVKQFGPGGRRRAGAVRALDGIDLAIPAGTITAVLGPNGAGKTTAVRILSTLLRPDAGTVLLDGVDVVASPGRVRRRIGLSGQYAAVDGNLTGFENLRMIGRLYGLPRRAAAARARELLGRFSLDDAADRPSSGYSGGMRRRLDLAGALVARPAVVVLDEPTTGLDPRGRREMWEVVEALVTDGTTVLLTTQYLEEADRLADAITVIDRGTVIARGTADELKAQVGGDLVTVEVGGQDEVPTAVRALAAVGDGDPQVDGRAVSVRARDGGRSLAAAVSRLTVDGVRVEDASLRETSLDEFFLAVTGREAAGADATAGVS
ncbi:ATP-binding cassette domain-containing protein [Tomitella fengzijianii]|uniref:ATP-binding cassette domain-containing protein n=1 Tax=Tomitella fengzijianii TaxID=2597660 RepID=A0A516X0K3_9ACTN|nr:ATP-binding cassette domain-containing protein [Tomitella fengzijianii]QDQ96583.1 ATP-binding cassette domain-containing protein [Tomitella fengzijianii]